MSPSDNGDISDAELRQKWTEARTVNQNNLHSCQGMHPTSAANVRQQLVELSARIDELDA